MFTNLKKIITLSILTFTLFSCNSTPETALNEELIPVEKKENSEEEKNNNETKENVDKENSDTNSKEKEEIITKSQGSFVDSAHKVSGEAKIVEVGDKNFLRLENFITENGPALYVYMVKNETGSPKDENDFLDLGKLKSIEGNFNYEIPSETNIEDFKSVSIWCKTFSVNFGFAELK